MKMRKLVPTVALLVVLPCFNGFASHRGPLHCPPGETLKNVLLDALDHSHQHAHSPHSPFFLKFNYHHYHWRLQLPFTVDSHSVQQHADQLRHTVVHAGHSVAKKIDRHYYCHYPALSKGLSMVLYTTILQAAGA